jgi:uncharacterized protein
MSGIDFQRGKVFRDPIHGLIRIEKDDEFLLDLINTPEFQRLRRVKQLGVSWLTYPGAEHSRFAHSLGVLAFAQRILSALQRRYQSGTEHKLLADHSREVKAAALLHDIGHGPFSHVVERAFGKRKRHEKRTEQLIVSPASAVNKVLLQHGVNPTFVRAIIGQVSDYPFLQDIVTSQLDADRMDSILRDAHSSGVRYGAFDSDWIVNSVCLGLDPIAPGNSYDVRHLRLCLEDRRGLHSAEQLIIARYHMSMQVYFHRTTRAWEAHLLMLLNEAKRLEADLPARTPEVLLRYVADSGEISDSDFLRLDDAIVTAGIDAWASSDKPEHRFLADLAASFLRREKRVVIRELTREEARTDRKLILQRCLERRVGLEGGKWLLDDVPFELYKFFGPLAARGATPDEQTKTDAILLSDGDLTKVAIPFEAKSLLFEALSEPPAGHAEHRKPLLCRLYFLPEVEEKVRSAFTDADDPLVEFMS